MPERKSPDISRRTTGTTTDAEVTPGRRGLFSSLMRPPPSNGADGQEHRPRRPPIKWRAVLLGTGVMLLGSILLQLAIAPVASRSQLVAFSAVDSRAKVINPGGRGPAGLAFDPTNRLVWMANSLAGEVASVMPDGGNPVETIGVGKGPVAMGVDRVTGNLVIANSGSNDLSILDPAARVVTATIGSGDNPAGVAIAPSARRAYVTNLRSGDLTVVDLDSKIVLARIPIGKDPQPVAAAGMSERIFAAATGDNEIKAVDSATGAITGTIRTNSTPVALAPLPDGTVVAALLQDKQLAIIDPTSMTITKTISLPSKPTGLAVHPVTGQIAAISWESSKAYVVEPQTQAITGEASLGVMPSSITVDPETGLYFVYGNVPVPAALNIAYLTLLLLVICAGGFVAGFTSKQEPVRHAAVALGGLALVIWFVLAGGRLEALFAVAFSAAFALPATALGGFLAGRKTGAISTSLRATLTRAITGRKSTEEPLSSGGNTTNTEDSGTSHRDAKSDRKSSQRRRSRRVVDSVPSDEPLD